MGLPPIVFFLFVACLEVQLVHNQYCSSYDICDPYACYGYEQPYYTQIGYPGACSQLGCDYYPSSYNPYRSEQPTVIILEYRNEDDGCEMDFLNSISSLQNQPNEVVYIPYPKTMNNCDNNYSDNGCLDCVYKNRGCGCSNKCENYDTGDIDCNCNCSCRNKEKSRSNCNSGKRSDTNCGCKKNVILHKSECSCRF